MKARWLLPLIGALSDCAPWGVTTVPLLASGSAVPVATPGTELEVVAQATAIADPLPVDGARVAYSEVEPALGRAVASAAEAWAKGRQGPLREGRQLTVELTQASAAYDSGRLKVDASVRATLRRSGGDYLAQTHASCSEAGRVEPERGAPIVAGCLAQIGRQLASWVGGLEH